MMDGLDPYVRRAEYSGSVEALPAPAPYDDPSGKGRIARILTDCGQLLLLDLLLGQLHFADPGLDDGSVKSNWKPFTGVGRIAVGYRVIVRLLTNLPLVTGPVASIEWMGTQQEILAADIHYMRVIGTALLHPPRRVSRRRNLRAFSKTPGTRGDLHV